MNARSPSARRHGAPLHRRCWRWAVVALVPLFTVCGGWAVKPAFALSSAERAGRTDFTVYDDESFTFAYRTDDSLSTNARWSLKTAPADNTSSDVSGCTGTDGYSAPAEQRHTISAPAGCLLNVPAGRFWLRIEFQTSASALRSTVVIGPWWRVRSARGDPTAAQTVQYGSPPLVRLDPFASPGAVYFQSPQPVQGPSGSPMPVDCVSGCVDSASSVPVDDPCAWEREGRVEMTPAPTTGPSPTPRACEGASVHSNAEAITSVGLGLLVLFAAAGFVYSFRKGAR